MDDDDVRILRDDVRRYPGGFRLAGLLLRRRSRHIPVGRLLALEKGEVRTKDLTDIGVPRCYLARMCEEGLLMKAGHGRYRAAVPKAA
ncbi:type IV toxin-antitoxin system AbiEi family antitoxin domain-containing protein [Mesorhizobium tianshanense]|uniref:type IV toxin-antitoxin system AbiEi family antitoxin domain-containing protein n=1 Tax=Mesorhizobium tianshanense TaxID=39844 RepID=UPI0030B88BD2